ncbi:metallophosphoesterase family protein [Telmatocola sphagniphila]|uniref:Metallophosphoesterase family protein n=1 Tax=Telmatocola sphagniphila TaxID=1123043 RepID=A0A8E6B5K0_9BACT|nr:metallophosphoesterase family protein [Telmatocola sphagniphila]QVL31757.1 metallophosphoesterase family protein [Telmatocola sphagniphila]
MFNSHRRLFLGASFSGLASYPLFGQEPSPKERNKEEEDEKKDPLPAKAVKEDAGFQPATLFLTWHKDPTTTMDVQWVGTQGETADIKVYYTSDPIPVPVKGAPKNPNEKKVNWVVCNTIIKPYPMSDFKVFRAEIAGLTPNTDYSFRIGKASPIYKFRTMPAKANDSIHFIEGGDCGINSAAIANNIMAAKQDPMFAIIGGDLGYDNGKSVDVSLSFLRNYSKHMVTKDGRMIPMITCIGNHEVLGSYEQKREKGTFFYPLFDGLYPETGYATLEFGDYLSLVLLDTGHTTPIAGEQTKWLEETLKARIDHPNTLVINHVPCYPSYRNPIGVPAKDGKSGKLGTGEGQRIHWVPLFEKYRVPLVLEHHDHTFKRTKPLLNGMPDSNGVLYLGDGSWGRIRNPRTPDCRALTAFVCDFNPQKSL